MPHLSISTSEDEFGSKKLRIAHTMLRVTNIVLICYCQQRSCANFFLNQLSSKCGPFRALSGQKSFLPLSIWEYGRPYIRWKVSSDNNNDIYHYNMIRSNQVTLVQKMSLEIKN